MPKNYDPRWATRKAKGGHPQGCNPLSSNNFEYSDDEREFMMTMDRYKRDNNRPYPTCAEVLAVAESLGYRRTKDNE